METGENGDQPCEHTCCAHPALDFSHREIRILAGIPLAEFGAYHLGRFLTWYGAGGFAGSLVYLAVHPVDGFGLRKERDYV